MCWQGTGVREDSYRSGELRFVVDSTEYGALRWYWQRCRLKNERLQDGDFLQWSGGGSGSGSTDGGVNKE